MKLTIYEGEEWSALYVNGQLTEVGDSYLAKERALELAGVEVIRNSDFFRGGNTRDGVAQTLDELYTYTAEREAAESAAAALRVLADELRANADALDGGRK